MKLYSENKDYKLYYGNMLDMLQVIEPNSIDSIVTDPPYGLTSITKRFGKENSAPAQYGTDGAFSRLSKGFMGKEWDGSGIEYNIDAWKKCYEVLKEGGYLLAFGGTRTYHRIACAIEDAGFEIRDTICWIYGSGFPKSMNIGLAIDKHNGIESKVVAKGKSGVSSRAFQSEETTTAGEYEIKQAQNKYNGWGTCLKPSFEPIIVARKPFTGSLVDNVLTYGVGGINIDECRVGNEIMGGGTMQDFRDVGKKQKELSGIDKLSFGQIKNSERKENPNKSNGRFPANTILTYDETDYEEVCGGFPNTKSQKTNSKLLDIRGNNYNNSHKNLDLSYERGFNDSGSAARYFYTAKASKKDRDEGLEEFEETKTTDGCIRTNQETARKFGANSALRKNIHPTVKPTDLMQYLVRLVTPDGGTILDPFNGSGSTGKAVMYENKERDKNYKYIGIELTEEYLPIAKARIEYVCNLKNSKQLSLFDK